MKARRDVVEVAGLQHVVEGEGLQKVVERLFVDYPYSQQDHGEGEAKATKSRHVFKVGACPYFVFPESRFVAWCVLQVQGKKAQGVEENVEFRQVLNRGFGDLDDMTPVGRGVLVLFEKVGDPGVEVGGGDLVARSQGQPAFGLVKSPDLAR